MKTIEILAFHRKKGSKSDMKKLRKDGHVPCVVYGRKEKHICCYVPLILFRELVYTDTAKFIRLNLEGTCMDCILQDLQFHPTSDAILHADFLILSPTRPTMMEIPLKCEGTAQGVAKGGKLIMHLRKVRVKALPKHLPAYLKVAVESLDIGQSIRVSELSKGDYVVLESAHLPLVSVQTPKALRKPLEEEEQVEEKVEEKVEEGASSETTPAKE